MRKLWAVMCVATLCGLLATPAAAQTQITTGVIQGTVVDATGAVVPGANIEARNLDTNAIRSLTSDGDGRFSFLLMPSGRYTLTATKDGFAKLVQENVDLTVGQTINLNLSMKVAAATEIVTVTGTPTVDTIKTEVSNTLNQTTVETTPVLGRKFEDLLTLTPGVSIVQGPDGDEITFNGQRGIYNNVSLDGGDYQNGFFGEQVGGQRAAIDIPLDAVKEFQVVATGANAEFGRTAAGVVNVITKSGTNDVHGNLFHYQRLEALTADNSDGTPNTDFHREQFGATIGGPVIPDKIFYFGAIERITGNLERANLSVPIGSTPCPQSSFTVGNAADEALINGNADCQRLALVEFFQNNFSQDESLPVRRPLFNTAVLGKFDWNVAQNNQLAISYNFDHSLKRNETFDVPTYGASANGTEGGSVIQVFNTNLYSTISPTVLNEFHFTYSRENRPRQTSQSNVRADVGIGFAPSFRFGNPFFLHPDIDEVFWRTQIKDNFSIVNGRHTIKFGGEWVHSLNDQVFRGFFTGRYLFSDTVSFLRYGAPAAAGGFGPDTVSCSDGTFVTAPATCAAPATPTGGPLLLYIGRAAGPPAFGGCTDACGASNITNEEFSLFVQDKWQVRPTFTLSFGLRWEAQFMADTVDPATTAFGIFLTNPSLPAFPSNGRIPDQTDMWQPRFGFAWDIGGRGMSVLRGNAGIYNARTNMLTQVGAVTTNGLQQAAVIAGTFLAGTGLLPSFIDATGQTSIITLPPSPTCTEMTTMITNPFPCGTGVTAFDRDYHNPRIYTWNVAFEQEVRQDWSAYVDFTWSKGVYLTRFFDINNTTPSMPTPALFAEPTPFGPFLGVGNLAVNLTNSWGNSLYRGATLGIRKRFSNRFQMEGNYVLSWDYDNDSNERDPFTDRTIDRFDTRLDYALSDRDIRHKFNFFTYGELPWAIQANVRMQARSAQPFPGNPGLVDPTGATVRNDQRKDNKFYSFDWRIQRPFRLGDRVQIIPVIEMFNTFNNDNLIIQDVNSGTPTTGGLFNFDGFLRQGSGDPRQLQLAVKFTF